jgi:hypothetical protein
MTEFNENEIQVPTRTDVWLAAKGTVAPVDCTADPGTGWFNVGYTPEDSLTFATEPTFGEVKSAQSNFPTLRYQTGESATVSVDLQQWNGANFKAVYGGGSITEILPATTPKQFKFVPPKIGERTEVAAIVQVKKGDLIYRTIVPRVFQMEGVSLQLHKGAESRLPLKLAVLGSDSADPWYTLTNDPAFDPAA